VIQPPAAEPNAMPVRTRRIEANGLIFEADEAGDGDAVALLLHGFPECRFSWRYQLPELAGLGWRAIAPDLRGCGMSSRPPNVADYRLDKLLEDVAALFEATGARRRLLIGHDWGGAIAWTFAARRRLPLDALVVMNCPHPAALARAWRSSWAQKMRSWYMALFQLPWLPEALMLAGQGRAVDRAFAGFPAEVREVYRRYAQIPGAMTAMINYYRANLRELGEAATAPIEVPTLMVWGEADRFLGPEALRACAPFASDLTIKRLPGVSHWVQQEAPEAVNTTLRNWLQERRLALP
jgi:pimeloyl-ACP methyl ester carboxylesterase